MIILKLEFQSSTIYIFENIFMALLVAVVIQFMVHKTSDSSIVRYENEGLCGYVLNS